MAHNLNASITTGDIHVAIITAPGRVNVIGEHIDYHNFSVLPFALDKVVTIEVFSTTTGAVEVENVDASFQPAKLPLDPNEDVQKEHHWTNYVHCGFKAAHMLIGGQRVEGFRMVVSSTLPAGCGLSSSSALVVASCLATLCAYGMGDGWNWEEIASVCCRAERFVGTCGGGMDQAASCLGQDGHLLKIGFSPLTSSPIPFPYEATFVALDSLVVSEKALTAERCFNKRYVEGVLAVKLLGKLHGIDDYKSLQTARELVELVPDSTPSLLSPEPYTAEDLLGLLECDDLAALFEEERRPRVLSVLAGGGVGLQLRRRLDHILSEAKRVEEFCSLCGKEGVVEELGRLMTASHESCRDNYECSCPELDELVLATLSAGAYGARLTGAGWGGSVVALVPTGRVGGFRKAMMESFYCATDARRTAVSTRAVDSLIVVSRPSGGASVKLQ